MTPTLRFLRYALLILLLALVACGGGEDSVTSTPIPATRTPRPTRTPKPTAHVVPQAPATLTPIPTFAPPDVTPPPTETPAPTPTSSIITIEGIEQPPYAESACSDRFPCNDDVAAWEARIRVPDGFTGEYFAWMENPDDETRPFQPTTMTFGPDGLLYVAVREGAIYTINAEGEIALFADGFTVPTGIAFQPGTNRLYIASRVKDTNVDGESQVAYIENGEIVPIIEKLPCCYIGMHAANGIAFGPDGYGYVGVGGRADHGEVLDGTNTQDTLEPYEAVILRFSPDGSEVEVYARGVRNPYDITWSAEGQLYSTDNGRDGDLASNEQVNEALHAIVQGGEHGYPYYDCPTCFGIPDDIDLVPPALEFFPHSVPGGIVTYLEDEFPGYYNSMFTVLWSAFPEAERVLLIPPGAESYSTFATGFSSPLDITAGPDGALYIADFFTGIIFKISYDG